MKIRIGLLRPSAAWSGLLRQEGVPHGVADTTEAIRHDAPSVLVVNAEPSADERAAIEEYLRGGGAILAFAGHVNSVAGIRSRRDRLEYLIADPHGENLDIGLLDLNLDGEIPAEANTLRTQSHTFAVFAGSIAGGAAVLLPFDVQTALADRGSATRNFWYRVDRLPSEEVSIVGKGEIRHLVHGALEFLHHVRGSHYAHLWYFPRGERNLFAYRVDTDRAGRGDIDDQYALAGEFGIGVSWYLDVKSHEPWLEHFRFMAGQELGLHCYEHIVYPGFEENLKNLGRGKRAMEAVGLHPEGVVAPFGHWNLALAHAIDALGFAYSSEFSAGYDTMPFHPFGERLPRPTLQVPIHPVCIGNLRKAGYSESRMKEYFNFMVDQKLTRAEPLFFYGHPYHREWDVIRALFRRIREEKIETTTLGEFALWWKRRAECDVELEATEAAMTAGVTLPGGQPGGDIWLRISDPGGREAFSVPGRELRYDALAWKDVKRYVPPADIARIREFDLRAVLGNLYSRFSRLFP